MSDKVEELTNETFAKSIESGKGYALVDFWAPWCGPCRMMAPVFESMAEKNSKVKFCKVNVDDQPDLSARFRVQGIPFFILFKDGKVVASRTGGSSEEEFADWLKQNTK